MDWSPGVWTAISAATTHCFSGYMSRLFRKKEDVATRSLWQRVKDLVRTEIVPLLEEYWFDAPDKVASASAKLLEGL